MIIENLLKENEFYYWFLFPTIIAVFLVTKTITILAKKKSFLNWTFSIIIIGLIIISEYILGIIFFTDSWPTFLPHIGIGLALIIYLIQKYITKITSR
ncbi:hypothetical protein [Kaistella palustris]|uniref:hypothetical protein n=1 Tax=Kaistella palustris TaxID=493376 RepID=UPI00040E2A15|nr:hypothetical protein [Kaistella palustris]